LSVSHDEEGRLEQQTKKLFAEYSLSAKKLSEIRTKASIKISSDIEKQLKLLSMTGAEFNVNLKPIINNDLGGRGQEEVEFLISTNPGDPCKSLARIASGGELSRISLAIQAIAAKNSSIPTLVFDEVDVGIGGATADIVGSILRDLGGLGQILCITHQPQVASKAHSHMKVSKNTKGNLTFSNIITLNDSEKVNEVARMLGGVDITDATLSHAEEMLSFKEKN
jgi:DNA repair protein RecN (Recombination protein N)